MKSFILHYIWRIADRFVRKSHDKCGGSPYRLCASCTTPTFCRNRGEGSTTRPARGQW